MTHNTKRILTIGGGTGQFALLSGLRDLQHIDISAVVSMADSGGSTGRLRDELGILPPGDALKCILALSPHRETARHLLLKRFTRNSRLRGHNAGNMLLTVLSWYAGNFPAGIQALAEILEVKGAILPVTTDRVTLVAELTDGSRIYGEQAIDVPRGNQREKIRDVFLVPHDSADISVYPPVIEAIESADAIVIGPGDLFTSILPNLIVPGVREALCEASARMCCVINLMTKYGETHHFKARDFAVRLEETIGRPFDCFIYNNRIPASEILAPYKEQQADIVSIDTTNGWWKGRTVYATDLLDTTGGIVRHDSKTLANLIGEIVCGKHPSERKSDTGDNRVA